MTTTGWFSQQLGVNQADVLFPTLFSIYVNYLVLRVTVNVQTVGMFLYADDTFLLAECEKQVQIMLNIVTEWCWNGG